MTAKVALPSEEQVVAAAEQMSAGATSSGRRPSVVELAGRLRLTNTTFWRHFPAIARQVAARRRETSMPDQPDSAAQHSREPTGDSAPAPP